MAESAASRFVDLPASGRTWSGTRRVRFGDVNPEGRVRLDALGTYIQDLASDDTEAAGLGADMVWVVRRAAIEVRVGPRFLDELTLTTWCSGLGKRWAERRVSMSSVRGASVDAALLWVRIDQASGRPAPLTPEFVALYGSAAAGREVSARLQHASAPAADAEVHVEPWVLRATDFDLLDHVNNAAAWAIVEEVLVGGHLSAPFRAEIEYRLPIEAGCTVELRTTIDDDATVNLWAVGWPAGSSQDEEPSVYVTAHLRELPG